MVILSKIESTYMDNRRVRDSNPCGVAPKRFSRNPNIRSRI